MKGNKLSTLLALLGAPSHHRLAETEETT